MAARSGIKPTTAVYPLRFAAYDYQSLQFTTYFLMLYPNNSEGIAMTRSITFDITIPAPLADVWDAWTTEEGAKTFFARDCNIELTPGGAYEMLFNSDAPPGEQGSEGMIILAVQPEKMLSFTWNSPPSLPEVRGEMTHVTLRFYPISPNETQISLEHDGWGKGEEWDKAFDYFITAWGEVVLPRLKYRFEEGPIDWDDPPAVGKRAG